jgi:lipoprotein signal peptidase
MGRRPIGTGCLTWACFRWRTNRAGNDRRPFAAEGTLVSFDTRAGSAPSRAAERGYRPGQWSVLVALLAAAIVLDQATKWWAWRHVPGAMINAGGDWLVGSTASGWYEGRVTGALLDLLDSGLVGIGLSVLIRRQRPTAVLLSGTLMVGGWGSNLLDRLGMHHLTAPGSVRGAVDFINHGNQCYNVADLVIATATPLFLVALGLRGWLATDRPAQTTGQRWRARARMSACAGAVCVMAIVAAGATYGG